ncbi:uncharacterized protein PV06_05084 [Exophiala oligosperma]|uniref:Zn(2)-C6 fungal-type domain-containing protein n=2 Tax=Chaetothyriales TaxID=34395 RepID=A0A0D2DM80_9EURO|nr:uncharacterized protein PV06_05084 [Exophiala oligosperma]KAJ9626125.1 hypothetical protein H2204_010076 [Knufia peltigerae]KIW44043.1 hypothetical protein PV06_05084 [Exophiala oligosperma]
MSAAQDQSQPQSQPVKASGQPELSAPRKRRKRAPAAGAPDDCFTCATRNVKCDRVRPYCSKCLDDGKDCAGYKTQLTWGNGVASRGKLRGLSLPVAGTQKAAPAPASPTKSRRRASQQRPQKPQFRADAGQTVSSPPGTGATLLARGSISITKDNAESNFQRHTSSFPIPVPDTTTSWATAAATTSAPASTSIKIENVDPSHPSDASVPRTSPLLTGHQFSAGFSSDIGYGGSLSPRSYPDTSPEPSYFGRVLSHETLGPRARAYPLSPQIHSPYRSVFSDHDQFPAFSTQETPYDANDGYSRLCSQQKTSIIVDLDQHLADEEVEDVKHAYNDGFVAVDEDVLVTFPRLPSNYNLSISPYAGMGAIGATPRIQYLINYYTEVISPVIVAFDGPSNPYRTHILRLAARSDTLQHAIAALSASNLRQRRETGALSTGKTDPARRSSIAHLTLTHESWQESNGLSPQDQAREEALHKGMAIQSLNRQLADPVLRKDDSILATLLILCLFHICDSGVAKFQTQFAGVKKLLGMRQHGLGVDTKEAKWFTRMFTWFDAMTATVNDREGQLQGHHLDVSALSDEDWALENLAGCDGQLFKTIAKLGRLNVLSQGKSVEETPTLVSRPVPRMSFGTNLDYSNFDGNGWMRIMEDENLFSSKTADPDVKTQFWREWREIRQTLQTWQLDTTMFDCSSPEAPLLTHEQRVDLANISESFRYSALLYTERLANPTVPSTDQSIRFWVQKCLMYIKAVKSDVYLLWPLFITGSECVDEVDREVIRERCLDIQKDSGFLNNKSCLELLEKVWHRYDEKERRSSPGHEMRQVSKEHDGRETGFRFTTIMRMEENEGEYIVV